MIGLVIGHVIELVILLLIYKNDIKTIHGGRVYMATVYTTYIVM